MKLHTLRLDRDVIRHLLEYVCKNKYDGEYVNKLCLVAENHIGTRLNQNLALQPIHQTVLHIHYTRWREVNDHMSIEAGHHVSEKSL